jgi:hypothetical protein
MLPVVCLVALAGGCASQAMTCPRVIFLDGAGWYTGDGPVRRGLLNAGYPGEVERFGWSAMLGAPLDHLTAGPDHPKTEALAERITGLRRENPDGHIVLIGLSSGTTLIVYALEKLPADIEVNDVVLLSSSISGSTDLRSALSHVKDKMYVTVSPHDAILALGDCSGPEPGEPAGRAGFLLPMDLSLGGVGQSLYRKIQYVPWRNEYAELGWSGNHTGVTSSKFIQTVIAPKIMPPPEATPQPAPEELAAAPANPAAPGRPGEAAGELAQAPAASRPAPQRAPQPAPPRMEAKAAELLKALARGDDSARRKAASDLKKFNLPPVVAALIDALQHDGSEDVRREAATSLGELTARDAQPALRKAAREDRDGGARKAALKSAVKIEAAYGIRP